MSEFRLPKTSQRLTIVGRTGSGKTQFGAWVLSLSHFDKQPYVIFDYKGDDLLNGIERAREIGLNELPKHPGIYIVKPLPEIDDERVENWLYAVWKRGRIGLYIDEGYMLPTKGAAFQACLTQGRSKKIPVITLSQRPVSLSRFIFSEADFHSVFELSVADDIKKVRQNTTRLLDPELKLPEYHSHWYDVGKDALFNVRPAPPAETILETFWQRLKQNRRAI